MVSKSKRNSVVQGHSSQVFTLGVPVQKWLQDSKVIFHVTISGTVSKLV